MLNSSTADAHEVPDMPQNVRELIANTIESVVVLEALLLFYHKPEYEWTEEEVAQELRVARPGTELRLHVLARAGLISEEHSVPPTYRYYPSSMEVNATVAALARTYAERPQTVIGFIQSRPSKTFWRSAADSFLFPKR